MSAFPEPIGEEVAERQGFESRITRSIKQLAKAGGILKRRLQPSAALIGLLLDCRTANNETHAQTRLREL